MNLSPSQVIVLATPVFLLLIGIELAWGRARGRNTYRLSDAVSSIGLGMLSQLSAVLTRALGVGIYAAVFGSIAGWRNDAFWTAWYGWLLALLFYDLCYYAYHRAGHESAVFWAAHVVHHQSQHYNLSTALRQTSSGALLGWIFYLPMAIAGVPPKVFGAVALVDLLYQFWVHTEHVPRLGWFDGWFCSPSNHRVHHAVNDRYLDRNYGGILIVWDRLFGSFREEDEPCVYGTRSPLQSWDPLWANLEVYWALLQDSWRARHGRDKLRVWFKRPGWRPADVAERYPKSAFDLAKVQRYEPAVAPAVARFGAIQFALLLLGVVLFLWHTDDMAMPRSAVWLAALTTGLWCVGALLQGRLARLEVLVVETAAAATATGALGLAQWHHLFKPLALMLAMAWVAGRIRRADAMGPAGFLLLAGLACSLAGDVLLMLPGLFIPGLIAFLAAHLCYIALFRQDAAWFPSRAALLGTFSFGAAMYAFLFASLGPVLKVAVGAYVVVIALMAAQAIGRATALRDRASVAVAVGAGFFMLSDSLLATNKFAFALPMSQFWVLATYYVAQVLIARHALASVVPPTGDLPAAQVLPQRG